MLPPPPSSLLPLLLLLYQPFTHARVQCSISGQGDGISPPNPRAADCQLILAHLPSTPPLQSHSPTPSLPRTDTTPPHTPITPPSSSFPFLPRALVSHGTCSVVFTYSTDAAYTPTSFVDITSQHIVELFGALKDAGQQTVRECASTNERHLYWQGTGLVEVRGVRAKVSVVYRHPGWIPNVMGTVQQLRAMMGGNERAVGSLRGREKPWWRYWEV